MNNFFEYWAGEKARQKAHIGIFPLKTLKENYPVCLVKKGEVR